jgi:PEP-CTERM motif
MKAKLIISALLLAASSAFGTVTLQFSNTTNSLANFANGAGVGGSNLLWGVVIDAGGNGFSTTYDSGLAYTTGTLQTLANTDDVFWIQGSMNIFTATQVTNGQADGQLAGDNRVTSASGVAFGVNGVSTGDAFKIIWFNVTAAGGSAGEGARYGTFSNASFILPGDGSTLPLASNFAGAEPLKTMNGTFGAVPEPSTALLGLLGIAGLLRRRR